jgi:hypothetical protein
MYFRALKELVNGPMLAAKINPIMDAKYAAFQAAGLSVTSPSSTESWIATARSSIATQVAAADVANFSLATNAFGATSNAVTLAGSAPFQITTIWINGEAFTPTWITPTNWSIVLPVAYGTNTLTISASDRFGNIVGPNSTATAANSSQPESPVGNVVLNEIMYNPAVSGGEFVELFNRATNTTFDLSGWTVNGLSYTFPSGSTLAPQSFLVLAKSRTVFAASCKPTAKRCRSSSPALRRWSLTACVTSRMRPGRPIPPGWRAFRCSLWISTRTTAAWPTGVPAFPPASCPQTSR